MDKDTKKLELNDEELLKVSGGDDFYEMRPKTCENTTENAHDSKDYSAGPNGL